MVPRADAVLAYRELKRPPSLGRGVFVLDASDSPNRPPSLAAPDVTPSPAAAFEVRRFGPFLVVRTREPTRTPVQFLTLAESVESLGRRLGFDDSVINLDIVQAALRRFQ